MKNPVLPILLFIWLLTSCGSGQLDSPYVYDSDPNYSWGNTEFFGNYYGNYGNKNNVISLSLFSDSLKINDIGNVTGTGQYLFLEDIYVSKTDTLLPAGAYIVNDSGLPFTVSPGKKDTIDNEVYQQGAYISYLENNSINSTIKLITSGSFIVSMQGMKYNIVFDLKTADSKVLKGTFTGQLPNYGGSAGLKESFPRKRLLYNR
jgi:hypothetical protein